MIHGKPQNAGRMVMSRLKRPRRFIMTDVNTAIIRALDRYPAPVRARTGAGRPMSSYNPITFALAGYAAVLQDCDDSKIAAAFDRAGAALTRRAELLETRLIHVAAGQSDPSAFDEAGILLTELGAVAAFAVGSRGATYFAVCDSVRLLSELLPRPSLDWVQQALAPQLESDT